MLTYQALSHESKKYMHVNAKMLKNIIHASSTKHQGYDQQCVYHEMIKEFCVPPTGI